MTPPVVILTGVTVLLQEDMKAPSSVPVVSITEVASTPPGAHAVEDGAPATVEEDVPAAEQDSEAAAGKVAVNARHLAAENPTAAAVEAQVRLPHLHVLLVLGPNTSPGYGAAQCAAAAAIED